MSGETENRPSGWTSDLLKILHDEKIAAVEKLTAAEDARLGDRIAAVEKVVDILEDTARIAQDKFEALVTARFVQVNEFRGSLDDLSKQMATRRELETASAALAAQIESARTERQHQIDDLRDSITELRSRIDVGPPALAQLQSRADVGSGRQEGVKESRAGLYAAIGAVAAALAIVIVLSNVLTKDTKVTPVVVTPTPVTTTVAK